ncbi:Cro/CI family transcriptional regulator [Serratia bockelmannii]|uniref:Cro/CI family transcriptional regulator n=1 Tax=Serratia TaxID=613 RepID=UPI0018D73C16|nr:Cro/CI family transcriptional regulator [Serratia marcescens]MBH3132637.1 Cro/Cl family transcriptional regulator [Serratia marcescens]
MRKSEVISYFGGVCKTAFALGIKHPSVSEWPEIIPEVRAYQVEKITNGRLKFDQTLYQNSTNTAAQA